MQDVLPLRKDMAMKKIFILPDWTIRDGGTQGNVADAKAQIEEWIEGLNIKP